MSKQFLPFRAPAAHLPNPPTTHRLRKLWLRLSRDVTVRLRAFSTRRRALLFILLSFPFLFLLFRILFIFRPGRRSHGSLSLRSTTCACPQPSTPALFADDVLARARFVASVTFLRYQRHGAIVFRINHLFRGPLRAAQYDIVVLDQDAVGCFTGLRHRRGEHDRWLLVGAGITAYEAPMRSARSVQSNLSRVLPGWMNGNACPRRHQYAVKDRDQVDPIVWLTPWPLVSTEVIEAIRLDPGDGQLWWRRKHASDEFMPSVHRAGVVLDHDHHNAARPAPERMPHPDTHANETPKEEEWWRRDGISIIAACKDREMTLSKVLHSWKEVRGIDEILLVDWSSQPSIESALAGELLSDDKITLVRVNSQNDWILSRAYNLAARLASYTKLMKVDCDTLLHKDFFEAHSLTKDTFFAGDWRQLESGVTNELHVNGLLFVSRDDFLAVGGYDERITTYGWDDSDIAERLSRIRKVQHFDYKKVQHIEHPASLRVVNQGHQSLLPPDNPHAAAVEIQRNRLLLTRFHIPEWHVTSLHTLWNVSPMSIIGSKLSHGGKNGPGCSLSVTAANEVTSVSSLVSDADALDVAKRAVRLILHRYGVQLLPKSLTLDFYKELITKVAFPENYAEVVLSFRGGCASRLLAYAASNQATTGVRLKDTSSEIADSSYVWPPLPYRGWRLQGLWRYPDKECSCKFSSVFDAQEEEIISTWEDKLNAVKEYESISERQPSVDVTSILKSFDSRAKEKVIPDELKRWSVVNSRQRGDLKPRILIDEFACDLDPQHLAAHRRDLIRAQLRKLVPSKQIQETVSSSLLKAEETFLDSKSLARDLWPVLVGKDQAKLVTDKIRSPAIVGMLSGWGASSVNGEEPVHRLEERAGSLLVAVNVAQNGVHAEGQLTAEQRQELNSTIATIEGRIGRLFIGCLPSPSTYLNAYPELALVLAGFLTCGTCV